MAGNQAPAVTPDRPPALFRGADLLVPDGYRGDAWPLLGVVCLHAECVALYLHYGDRVGDLYEELRVRGWTKVRKRPARAGWRCPRHRAYVPPTDDWMADLSRWRPPRPFRGRVKKGAVLFCGEPGCVALRFDWDGGPWLPAQEGRKEGWRRTRFGWRCPAHAMWWRRSVPEAAS